MQPPRSGANAAEPTKVAYEDEPKVLQRVFMRGLIVFFAVIVGSLPALAQYQGMTQDQCRRLKGSQQRLTCLGQVRPPPPGPSNAGPFGPVGLLPQVQPVAQPAPAAAKPPERPAGNARASRKSGGR
jgi:hypothetical protein